MATEKFAVRYYHSKPGSNARTSSSLSGTVKSKSETLVLQELRKKHKGEEIELIDLKWR